MSSLLSPAKLGRAVVPAAWAWMLLVLAVSFWGAWDIPARLPDINDVATTHLFLAPVSLLLFLLLSWIRKCYDDEEARPGPWAFTRWRATLGIWILAFLHPVSCGLYPAAFNLDTRTVEAVTQVVGAMQAGMPRAALEERIVRLNETLPVSMRTDRDRHRRHQEDVARYLAEQDPAVRGRLWAELSRATFVFMPWSPNAGEEPARHAREQVFLRRTRATSDIGVDKIRVRYGPALTVEEIVYSSNRQLLMERQPCTVHIIVPAPPEAEFPYPCQN
ncbi:MAG: hypothetical protein EPO02_12020 [Nitrospirae bacterium]|nr:MAG: hypothetical protein EPO02_12020 [Nitrospirota bacterium]